MNRLRKVAALLAVLAFLLTALVPTAFAVEGGNTEPGPDSATEEKPPSADSVNPADPSSWVVSGGDAKKDSTLTHAPEHDSFGYLAIVPPASDTTITTITVGKAAVDAGKQIKLTSTLTSANNTEYFTYKQGAEGAASTI